MASIWGAYQAAQTTPPDATYTFFYANGKSEQVHASQGPSEMARALTKWNNEKEKGDPYRTVRAVDQQGRVIWGK